MIPKLFNNSITTAEVTQHRMHREDDKESDWNRRSQSNSRTYPGSREERKGKPESVRVINSPTEILTGHFQISD